MIFDSQSDRPINEGHRPDPSRLPQHRDGDRVLYSNEFRRLTGVTQVTSPQDDYVYHDRLTHSLKVAQVGVRLAQRLIARQPEIATEADADVVYAVSLAHDIGHPPFGHAAEIEFQRILAGEVNRDGSPGNRISILEDSFEGNAQSFRIVTRLSLRKSVDHGTELPPLDREKKTGENSSVDELETEVTELGGGQGSMGLNLTWQTLFALQKYPWIYGEGPQSGKLNKKWGFYYSEREYYDELVRRNPDLGSEGARSVNAQIMDWADDIAYAIHDSEDFYKAGLIPLERLYYDDVEWMRFADYAVAKAISSLTDYLEDSDKKSEVKREATQLVEGVLKTVRVRLPRIHFDGSLLAHDYLHNFATKNIETLSREAKLMSPTVLSISTAGRLTAEILKGLTSFYVHRTPALFATQQGQRRVVRELFFDLWDVVRHDTSFGSKGSKDTRRLPLTVLPPRLWEFCEHVATDPSMASAGSRDGRLARAVVDFICSLTDKQATLLNERLTGNTVGALSPYWLTV